MPKILNRVIVKAEFINCLNMVSDPYHEPRLRIDHVLIGKFYRDREGRLYNSIYDITSGVHKGMERIMNKYKLERKHLEWIFNQIRPSMPRRRPHPHHGWSKEFELDVPKL